MLFGLRFEPELGFEELEDLKFRCSRHVFFGAVLGVVAWRVVGSE